MNPRCSLCAVLGRGRCACSRNLSDDSNPISLYMATLILSISKESPLILCILTGSECFKLRPATREERRAFRAVALEVILHYCYSKKDGLRKKLRARFRELHHCGQGKAGFTQPGSFFFAHKSIVFNCQRATGTD